MAQYSPQQQPPYGQPSQFPQYQQSFEQSGYPQTAFPQQMEFPHELQQMSYPQQFQLPPQAMGQFSSPQPVFARPLDDVPAELLQLASERQLGPPRALYKPRLTSGAFLLSTIITLALVEALCIYLLFMRFHTVPRLIAFPICVLPIVGIIYAIDAYSHHGHRVYLFTYGLIYLRGKNQQVLRWDEVSAVWHRWMRQTTGVVTHRYEIQRYDGATLKLGNIMGDVLVHTSELGSLIEHEVMNTMLPSAQPAFDNGQILSFGKVSMSLQGLANGPRTIPWSEITTIDIERGGLVVRKDNKTTRLHVSPSDIPNFPLMLHLIAHGVEYYGSHNGQ